MCVMLVVLSFVMHMGTGALWEKRLVVIHLLVKLTSKKLFLDKAWLI